MRSIAWRRTCAAADASRLRGEVARAFADRARIDWAALLIRLRDPDDRRWAESLRQLERLRPAEVEAARNAARPPRLLLPLLALAALQTADALGATVWAVASGMPLHAAGPGLPLTLAFAGASLLLSAAAPRDSRVLFLLTTFAFAAAAFARAIPAGMPEAAGILSRGLYPEAFAPAALWEFAAVFPHVRRFAPFDVLARRAAVAAWGIGGALLLINVGLEYGVVPAGAAPLARNHPGNLFWHAFALLALPALLAVLVRARRADAAERRKAVRFATAVFACAAPLLVAGILRLAFPRIDGWVAGTAGGGHPWLDLLVLGTLAALPILTTLAVVVDRTFEARITLPHAAEPAPRPAAGLFRWPSGRSRHRERLTEALARVRGARGARELALVLRRELEAGVNATHATLLSPSSLPPGSSLIPMLSASSSTLDLAEHGPLFALMPRTDREWLAAAGIVLAAPVARRDGTVTAVAALGAKRDGSPYDRADRWLVGTLLAGSAAVWDLLVPQYGAADGFADAALECPRCGVVADAAPLSCGCPDAPAPATLPRRLAGKFTVLRRLGSGGMGLVYLARDEALGREVALKTLPALAPGAVSRLSDEARTMAALNHESLATIYGLEVWRDTPILVVEYLERGTLADALARGPLGAAAAIALGIRLTRALEYMHARGVLHRDIKPSNIGLTLDGEPKLLDFGLAADPGPLAGTPAYLPPEALDGAPPDEAGDLWSLALVLVEACGGRDRVPRGLAVVVNRALDRDPGARFGSAASMRRALEEAAAAPA